MTRKLIEDVFKEMCEEHPTVILFAMLFSRFEHALKRSGYLKLPKVRTDQNLRAEPNWESFFMEKSSNIEQIMKSNEEFKVSVDYIIEDPPRKLIVTSDDKLEWVQVDRGDKMYKVLNESIRMIRNNLLHGEKSPRSIIGGGDGNTERDLLLIESAYCILKELAESKEIKKYIK